MTMSHTSSNKGITLTEKAALELKKNLPTEMGTHWGIKFGDEVSTCGEGYNYILDYTASPTEQDEIFLSHGIKIYVSKSSLPRLNGSVIDCQEESSPAPMYSKAFFKKFLNINNPNAKGPCPCACGTGAKY